MVFVHFGRYAVLAELSLQLHLSPPQYIAADRARLTAPGAAHRAVRPSCRQLSTLDRFAGFVADSALVHQGFESPQPPKSHPVEPKMPDRVVVFTAIRIRELPERSNGQDIEAFTRERSARRADSSGLAGSLHCDLLVRPPCSQVGQSGRVDAPNPDMGIRPRGRREWAADDFPIARFVPEAVPALELHGQHARKGTSRHVPSNDCSDAHPVQDRLA